MQGYALKLTFSMAKYARTVDGKIPITTYGRRNRKLIQKAPELRNRDNLLIVSLNRCAQGVALLLSQHLDAAQVAAGFMVASPEHPSSQQQVPPQHQ